jgi:hypothetical protein
VEAPGFGCIGLSSALDQKLTKEDPFHLLELNRGSYIFHTPGVDGSIKTKKYKE